MPVQIRLATTKDRDPIRAVHLRAFPESERHLVATLAANLLSETTEPETMWWVAVCDGDVVGHMAVSPVTADVDAAWEGYILAPLGVVPEHQARGIGTKLVRIGIDVLSQRDTHTLFVYGDPRYYGAFGFSSASAVGFFPPYELEHPIGWQARMLRPFDLSERIFRLSCVPSLRDPAYW
jgi:putative acetyltransferase